MNNRTAALFAAIIFLLTMISYSFVDKGSARNTSIARTYADQTDNQGSKVRNRETDEQYRKTKHNSFSVGQVFGEEQANLNTAQAMVDRGKNYLLKQVNNRINQLGPFRSRIENMAALNATERKSLVSELNSEIEMFEALKSEIGQSATKEDIKNVADKVKAEWMKSRRSVEYAKGKALAAKENQLISDADFVSFGIKKRMEFLKASGKETKAHEKLLSAYSKKIAGAKQDVEFANKKSNGIASASTDDEKEKLIKEKDLLLKSSQENIRDAYKILADGAREDFSRKLK